MVLKFVLLFIGACVMAPLALLALLVSIPALPFLLAGWVLFKLVQRRSWFGGTHVSDKHMIDLRLPRHLPLAPLALVVLMCAAVLQIKLSGFSWNVDRWSGAAMLAVAALWWLQRRAGAWRRNRFGSGSGLNVAQYDLYRLFEIERAGSAEERRVLIVRELNRLTLEALRSDPMFRSTWPTAPELVAIRDQVRVLRSSLADAATNPPANDRSEHQSRRVLLGDIDALERYVSQFLRVRLIGHDDLEQIRILVRDQSRLRAIQDQIVDQLQVVTVAIAG